MWRFVFLLFLLGGFCVNGFKLEIKTYTSDKADAGTDSRIYITLFGTLGSSEEIELENAENNFERGKIDRFFVSMDDIGEVCSVRIRSDDSKLASGWHLQKIWVKSRTENNFWCNCWLSKETTLQRELTPEYKCHMAKK